MGCVCLCGGERAAPRTRIEGARGRDDGVKGHVTGALGGLVIHDMPHLSLLLLSALLAAVRTADPLATVATPASLAAAAAGHSRLLRNGYLRLPGVLAPAAARAWAAVALEAVASRASSCAARGASPQAPCEPTPPPGERASFLRARALAPLRPLTHASHEASLAHLVAAAMNVSGLRLYSASVFLKRPGDGLSLWHQDAAAMPLRTDKIATLWVALDDVPAEAGPLRFVRGSHLPGVPLPSLRDLPPRERTVAARLPAAAREVERDTGLAATAARAMAAGDATLHLGWTLHGAAENAAGVDRVGLALTFFEDGARVDPHLLEQVPPGGAGAASPAAAAAPPSKGVRFRAQDGGELVVHLLADDRDTWEPWLHARPPLLVPGAPVRDAALTPLLFNASRLRRRQRRREEL